MSCANAEIEQMMAKISNNLASLKSRLDVRISISEQLVKFYKLFGKMSVEMNQIERQLFGQSAVSYNYKSTFEESRLLIQQLYLQVTF